MFTKQKRENGTSHKGVLDMKDLFEITDSINLAPHGSVLKWGTPSDGLALISIVIPVYKSFDFFTKALSSAINQSYKGEYTIVVVDNNFEDDVNAVNQFEQYIVDLNCSKILYYKNEKNMGPAHNFNRAAFLANSEYFVMCHEDDELSENCLETLLQFKKEHSVSCELVLTPNTIIDENSNIKNIGIFNHRIFRRAYCRLRLWDFFLGSPSNGCGCLLNRNAFIEIGGYNPDYRPSADYAMLSVYVYKYGGYRINNKSLYRYRIADQNASNKVFYTCIERDEFYRNCMKKKIALPNFILDRIIKANKNCHTERTEQLWLHKVDHPASFSDKFVMAIVVKTNNLIRRVFG